ncbi:MAG: winged helix-turn-helix transcriptional regulator [Spirochaetales bacterium]|nr:winged helix-turn-helix transcriptional regulator [Spirochaetales bacterium]
MADQSATAISQLVLSTLRQITREIDLYSKQLVKRVGMTVPQLLVLKEVVDAGELPMGKLAERVSLSQATITSIVDRLESHGQIERRRSKSDRRQILLRATDQGRKIVEDNPSILQEDFLEAFRKLKPWEQTQILSSLQRVATMMNAHKHPVSPFLHAGDEP